MKRIISAIVAVAAIVLAIALTRAFTTSPPPPGKPVVSSEVDSSVVARHLAEAIRFQTISYGGDAREAEKLAALDAMRRWLEQTYPHFHAVATREVFDHTLLFAWKGRAPSEPPVLLMAHMDVVPVVPGTERDWAHPPFSGDIADGFVWGRGAIDDKGSLVAILEAAERLAASGFTPARTILFAFGQDEEVGGRKGNAVVAEALAARGVHLAWVLDEGGSIVEEPFPGVRFPIAAVSVAEKGYLSVELVARGQGGHSSRPSKDLAIVRLSEAVLDVVHHPFAAGLDAIQRERLSVVAQGAPFLQRILLANLWLTSPIVVRMMESIPADAARLRTTIAPTMLSAGVKDNVLPPVARATVNLRLHPRDTIAGALSHLREAIGDAKVDVNALRGTSSEASRVSDLHGTGGAVLAEAIHDAFGVPVAPDITSAATDSRHYQPIADQVFHFAPFPMGPGDTGVHGTNERLRVRDLGPAVGFYMRLMLHVQ